MVSSIKWIFSILIVSLLIFLNTPTFNYVLNDFNFWTFRVGMLYFTGVSAILLMSSAVILSIRLPFINNIMNGLDKSYYIHKWIGISAFIMMILHYLTKQSKSIVLKFNLLEPAPKSTNNFTELQSNLYHLGNDIVEYVFYIMVIILLVTLIKKIPYNKFIIFHKLIPFLFLLIAFHGFTIQIRGYWYGSLGSYLLTFLLSVGVIAAFYSLFQITGKKNKYTAYITNTEYLENIHSLSITLKIDTKSFIYNAGQYVFLQFPHSKEIHPFSICSYNKDLNELSFLIKELGDYTKSLRNNLKNNQKVIIEGPYGNFNFNDNKENQIWISAGAGITPFMAMVDYLVDNKTNKHIDFYFSNKGKCEIKNILEEKCKNAGINFHFVNTLVDNRLNIEDIIKNIDKNNTSIWFCGPKLFYKNIVQILKKYSFPKKNIHFDYFNMR